MLKFKRISAKTKNNFRTSAVSVLSIGAIGSLLLIATRAATPASSIQAEAGTVSGNAQTVSDGAASGGSAVQFGTDIRNLDANGIGFNYPDYPAHTDAEQKRDFAAMKALGASWVRLDISWSIAQPKQNGSFTWSHFDSYINNAVDAGLKVDGLLVFSPTWAVSAACHNDTNIKQKQVCPPADPDEFAGFARAAVQNYGQKLAAVEIWNEPNIYQFWSEPNPADSMKPQPNAEAYTALLKASYTSIKAVDPRMLVMTGGISVSYNDYANHAYIDHRTYLQRMYAAGAKNYFDAVAYHPYSGAQPPSEYNSGSGWSQIFETPSSMRSVMVANGDANKRIWNTEYGAPTGGPASNQTATCSNYTPSRWNVDECLQARMLSDAVTATYQHTDILAPTFIYSFIDRNLPGGETQEKHYGIENLDTTPKQSYAAVRAAIAANR